VAFELPIRDPCPFCENIAGRAACAVIEELDSSLAFVNPRQYRAGAALVIPRRHAATLLDLHLSEVADLARHVQRVASGVSRAFAADGLNVFQNNGVAAGQSVPHYHVHILPRHNADGYVIYGSEDFPRTPMDDRLKIAKLIAQALPRDR
jgi:histidine triad (HIT) family protein